MKVAIPVIQKSKDSIMDSRFGRSSYYVIYNSDTAEFEEIDNPAFQARGGAGTKASQYLIDLGVKVVIAPHVGPNAVRGLKSANIEIYKGEPISAVELVKKWQNNQLEKLGDE